MVALLIKEVIFFIITSFVTYVWIKTYDSKEWLNGLCTVIAFYISVATLFNIIDLIFG